jgi:PAS domain S-box-containing protein
MATMERSQAAELIAAQTRVLERITSGAALSAVLEELTALIEAQSAPGLLASILLLDADGVHLRHGAAPSLPEAYCRAIDGLVIGADVGSCGTAAYLGDRVVVDDIATDPRWAAFRDLAAEHGLAACWSTPIVGASGRTLGTFAIYYPAPQPPRPGEMEMVDLLTRTAALAIERDQAEAASRAAEARYRTVFEGVADTILVSDAEGRILDANLPAAELTGYSVEELRQQRIMDVCAMGPGWIETEFARFLEQGHWRGEAEIARKDGTRVPIEVRATVADARGSSLCISVLRDASERRTLERLQREFIAMIAHDLKTPLTSIGGYAQLMQRRQAYDERATTTILSQTRRLERLLSDLLDAAQVESGRLKLRRAPVDLVALARACVEDVRATTDHHQFRLEAPEAPLEGDWDHDRLMQVLENLLSNAIKYSPAGGPIVVRLADLGEAAQVAVADEGNGIAAAALPRIFDRFFRTDAADLTARGLGLGLHISKLLVEAHGGRIWAASPGLGHGSTFTVVLPYRAGE